MVAIDALMGFVARKNIARYFHFLDQVLPMPKVRRIQGFIGRLYQTDKGTVFLATESPDVDQFGKKRNTDEYYIQSFSSLSQKVATLINTDCFRATRLDLKVDVLFEDKKQYTVQKMSEFAQGHLRCKQSVIQTKNAITASDTLYLRDRRSSFFVRIYEKGKQARLDNKDIVRIEIQCNAKISSSVWYHIQNGKVEQIFIQLWKNATENREYFRFFHTTTGEILALDIITSATDYRSREEYINEQILSRIRKLYSNNELVNAFLEHIKKEQETGTCGLFHCQHFFENEQQ